MSAVCEVQVNL